MNLSASATRPRVRTAPAASPAELRARPLSERNAGEPAAGPVRLELATRPRRRLAGAHQLFVLWHGQRLAEVEALVLIAAEAFQQFHLLEGLNAFCDHLQAQAVCKRDDAL